MLTKVFFGLQGLLVLLWVYLVDLLRRYVTTHEIGEVFFYYVSFGYSCSVCVCVLLLFDGELQ